VIDVYLFDWGDTLMVDIPGVSGKMCDWEVVEVVDGAKETLEFLSQTAEIYIATGAADSKEQDIEKALSRVGLSRFISGYFCEANLGIPKGSPEYLPAILDTLKTPKERVAMVGDSLAKDIEPAVAVGIKPIWVSEVTDHNGPENTRIIRSLRELCI
jgi:putative hydrolase of the HAD superfamily